MSHAVHADPPGAADEAGGSCCRGNATPEDVRSAVRAGYGAIARGEASPCCGGQREAEALSHALGYSAEELAALPEGANLGLSCGNPIALAALQAGEVVVDLGAGAGFDLFVAAARVGATGRALGVDMTPDMIDRARANARAFHERTGLDNVEFRLGEIEHLPVANASVDAVISNCVINLSPHKAQAWREIARVLKPGGRVAVSDIALKRPLPPAVSEMVAALLGCVAGAVLVADTEAMARDAGLVDIELEDRDECIAAMSAWQDPLYCRIVEHLPADTTPVDFVTSLSVRARKPAGGQT